MSITAKVKYLKSVLRFLVGLTSIIAAIAWRQIEDRIVTSIISEDYEPFIDSNGNNIWDDAEPFTDKGNGIYDAEDEFIDINGKMELLSLEVIKNKLLKSFNLN